MATLISYTLCWTEDIIHDILCTIFGGIDMENKKQNDYAVIKVIATILVVFAHVTRFYSYGGGVIKVNPDFFLHYVTSFIYSFHMPLFIFVSGAVYSVCINREGKYTDFRKFLKDKFKRLMIPYFAFGIFYVTPVMILLKITDLSQIEYILKNIVLSLDARHLWFLWTLFFIFVTFRLFRSVIVGNKIVVGSVLFLLAVFSSKMPVLLELRNIIYYIFFFWLGYEFDSKKNEIDKILDGKRYLVIFEWLFISFVVLYTYNNILNLITSCVGILMSYQIIKGLKKYVIMFKYYDVLLKDSFGIYLFHPMIVYVLFYFFGKYNSNPFLFCVIVFIIAIIVSDVLTKLIRALKIGIIIGE